MTSERRLDLDEIAQRIEAISNLYAQRFDIDRDDHWYLGKISEELGELTAAYFKMTGRGRANGRSGADLREQLEDEFADLFAHVVLFARRHEIDIRAAVARKWLAHDPGADETPGAGSSGP